VQRLVAVSNTQQMDYNVSSKREQRGILTGMLLGVGRRNGNNFFIQHADSQIEYLLCKKTLLEGITRKPASLCKRIAPHGGIVWRLQPKQIPLIRVLIQQLYAGGDRQITRRFLNQLTPQGIAIWFLDCGSKSLKRREGSIRALDVYLNTHLSRTDNEVIVAYFAAVWGVRWGLSKSKWGYRLRLGTTAGKAFFAFLQPYVPPCQLAKIQTSSNITAAT
jgi:hypothetical protein